MPHGKVNGPFDGTFVHCPQAGSMASISVGTRITGLYGAPYVAVI